MVKSRVEQKARNEGSNASQRAILGVSMDSERGTSKEYFRSQDQVERDCIMPFLGLGAEPGTEVRVMAILEVLRRLPEKDYRRLEELDGNNEFQWFIPNPCWLGGAYPFPANIYGETEGNMELAPYAKVIYLSPVIEDGVEYEIAVAVVAHELAHIILSHKVRPDPKAYDKQEKEAWEKVIEWSFKEEERKHREYSADPRGITSEGV